MPSGFITGSTLPGPVQAWFDENLLNTPQVNLNNSIAAVKKTLPEKNSSIIIFRRRGKIALNKVPLARDGTTPPPSIYENVDIKAEVQWYGVWVGVNEQIQKTSQDPVLNGLSINLGINMRESEDALIGNMLESTANYIDATGGGNGDNPTQLTSKTIDKAVRTLVSNNAETTLNLMTGSPNKGSNPLPNSYLGLCHTDLIPDLENLTKWINVANYANPKGALDSEWGSISRLRVLVSSQGSKIPSASTFGSDVYNLFCVGINSYAVIELGNTSAEFMYNDPKIAGGPLRLNSSAGYKMAFAPKILNDEHILAIRTTKSS